MIVEVMHGAARLVEQIAHCIAYTVEVFRASKRVKRSAHLLIEV